MSHFLPSEGIDAIDLKLRANQSEVPIGLTYLLMELPVPVETSRHDIRTMEEVVEVLDLNQFEQLWISDDDEALGPEIVAEDSAVLAFPALEALIVTQLIVLTHISENQVRFWARNAVPFQYCHSFDSIVIPDHH